MLHDVWRRFIESMGYPDEMTAPLLQEDGFVEVCESLPLGMGRQFHACTHTTMAPTIVHGGTKINVIPDTVDLELDIRTLPGPDHRRGVPPARRSARRSRASSVDIVHAHEDPSTASPIETPLWDALSRVTQTFYEGSATVPFLTVGATDARFFRRAGSTAYGFGLFSTRLSLEDYGVMFHGDDERVDIESLRLSTELWHALAHDLLELVTRRSLRTCRNEWAIWSKRSLPAVPPTATPMIAHVVLPDGHEVDRLVHGGRARCRSDLERELSAQGRPGRQRHAVDRDVGPADCSELTAQLVARSELLGSNRCGLFATTTNAGVPSTEPEGGQDAAAGSALPLGQEGCKVRVLAAEVALRRAVEELRRIGLVKFCGTAMLTPDALVLDHLEPRRRLCDWSRRPTGPSGRLTGCTADRVVLLGVVSIAKKAIAPTITTTAATAAMPMIGPPAACRRLPPPTGGSVGGPYVAASGRAGGFTASGCVVGGAGASGREGGYHLPSEASHHPSPCDWSLMKISPGSRADANVGRIAGGSVRCRDVCDPSGALRLRRCHLDQSVRVLRSLRARPGDPRGVPPRTATPPTTTRTHGHATNATR